MWRVIMTAFTACVAASVALPQQAKPVNSTSSRAAKVNAIPVSLATGKPDWRFAHPNAAALVSLNVQAILSWPVLETFFSQITAQMGARFPELNASAYLRSSKLAECKAVLDRSRLVAEDTLCHDSMTQAERKWLRHNRSSDAEYWNLLTDLKAEHLAQSNS